MLISNFVGRRYKPLSDSIIEKHVFNFRKQFPASFEWIASNDSHYTKETFKTSVRKLFAQMLLYEFRDSGIGQKRTIVDNQRCTNHCSGPKTPYHKWFSPYCDNHDDCYLCVSMTQIKYLCETF